MFMKVIENLINFKIYSIQNFNIPNGLPNINGNF